MSLQRRLLVYLLLCAPLVWGAALLVSTNRARHEVNELFDTESIRLARQVQATLAGVAASASGAARGRTISAEPAALGGEADLRTLSIAVWDGRGDLLLVDREGVQLPRRTDASGFVDLTLDGEAWRVYYLQAPQGQWLVASGQLVHERDELVRNLLASQMLPWLLVLPVLMAAMAWAVREALAPVRALAADLQSRTADDLRPVSETRSPQELKPLLAAMNGLFLRIESTLARERRFTADAAHELRTPLAVWRAQWDVVRRTSDASERQAAEARLTVGLDRVDRLVTQLLMLSRLEATDLLPHSVAVDWTALVAQAMDDVLPLAERRRIDLACEWPPSGTEPFPVQGDADLLSVLLRNLVDNAVRYAPEGTPVTLRFRADSLEVENGGPPLSPDRSARLGERFRRADGQAESGSGLGLSIAQRVATLHRLRLSHRAGPDGSGVVAELARA